MYLNLGVVRMKISMYCAYCDSIFNLEKKEFNRQKKAGRSDFFCCRSCAAKHNNIPRKNNEIAKTCPVCYTVFKTKDGHDETTFCSRRCATMGSMTPEKYQSMMAGGYKSQEIKPSTAYNISTLLKKREAWKYEKLKDFLEFIKEPYEFEYVLEQYVYDLALPSRKLLIEFDGDDHGKKLQRDIDEEKDINARINNWKIIRISVNPNYIIDSEVLHKALVE